jgi:hypothetical protein
MPANEQIRMTYNENRKVQLHGEGDSFISVNAP